jgi:hypothetical protein
VACEEFTPVLVVFSVDSPATESSPAERVLAEANIPAPAKALRMNPRLLLMCALPKKLTTRVASSQTIASL